MKFIKYFVLITAIIYGIGLLSLINDGTADFYSYWGMTAVGLSAYALWKK
jgi:hypothetical protein